MDKRVKLPLDHARFPLLIKVHLGIERRRVVRTVHLPPLLHRRRRHGRPVGLPPAGRRLATARGGQGDLFVDVFPGRSRALAAGRGALSPICGGRRDVRLVKETRLLVAVVDVVVVDRMVVVLGRLQWDLRVEVLVLVDGAAALRVRDVRAPVGGAHGRFRGMVLGAGEILPPGTKSLRAPRSARKAPTADLSTFRASS